MPEWKSYMGSGKQFRGELIPSSDLHEPLQQNIADPRTPILDQKFQFHRLIALLFIRLYRIVLRNLLDQVSQPDIRIDYICRQLRGRSVLHRHGIGGTLFWQPLKSLFKTT